VSNDTKQLLEQINNISRQLLSRLLAAQKEIKANILTLSKMTSEVSSDTSQLNDNEKTVNNIIDEEEINKLMSERDSLIKSTFQQNSSEKLAQESNLLNTMLSLDKQLLATSKEYKKTLTEHVIKLKKREKVSKYYQKY
jgi:hypothetical protein